IALYSAANLANAYVGSVPAYACWRFLAGLGLAGELGAAVTLVSEILPKDSRGYGTALVAGVGVCGTVAAALNGKYLDWRHAYLAGGGLGVVLLFLRAGLRESLMFSNLSHANVSRGAFLSLFTNRGRLERYLRCILIGLPMWYAVGILVIFIPEFAPSLRVASRLDPAVAVACCYGGIAIGSLGSGFMSQLWGTRTKVIGLFMAMVFLGMAAYLLGRGFTPLMMYAVTAWLGLASGYWAVFVTVAAEQFGTNLRSTVATTVPNFVRGSVVLITTGFLLLKGPLGMLGSAWVVGLACFGLAAWSLAGLEDTHGRDLDFLE
ncbi:MAG: MFS transporter, partial [Elusimicrobia bacterium]|nr:MFS transporter [Elusimicrobiota bacterium]